MQNSLARALRRGGSKVCWGIDYFVGGSSAVPAPMDDPSLLQGLNSPHIDAAGASEQLAAVQPEQGWLRWGGASLKKIAEAEARLFSTMGTQIISRFVPIRFNRSDIYTVTSRPDKPVESDPVVMIHGFGAGVAMWCANIGHLSQTHTVHAFDLLGFGRSSRARFSSDETLAELEMVEAIEDWRKGMGIESMYLVAHSFGGYLASSYTLEHPNRVKHLVLVDPWGFGEKPEINEKEIKPSPWMKLIAGFFTQLNPLAPLRAVGPYGPSVVKKLRPDLGRRYRSENPDDIYEYIYNCNAQEPTGEEAFRSMTYKFGWAKRPMVKRFCGIDESVPVTFIYGSKSWIDPGPAFDIQAQREGVNVQIIRGAAHHVYADAPQPFNDIVAGIVNGIPYPGSSAGEIAGAARGTAIHGAHEHTTTSDGRPVFR